MYNKFSKYTNFNYSLRIQRQICALLIIQISNLYETDGMIKINFEIKVQLFWHTNIKIPWNKIVVITNCALLPRTES